MLTPLQIEKLTHFFNILDFDKNGFIEKDDFEAIGDNLCIVRDFDFDTVEYDTILKMTTSIWDSMTPYVQGTEGTLEQWLEFMSALLDKSNAENYKKYIYEFVNAMFKLFDIDHDGFISQMEYIDLFIGLRIEVRFAPKAFKRLDENGDGRLSNEELIQSVHQFMKSDNPTDSGNWLFGSWDD